jgi:hypothetical protein
MGIRDDIAEMKLFLEQNLIQAATVYALCDYVSSGKPVGSFLQAVIDNDLKSAVLRADAQNTRQLAFIIKALWNYAPPGCWGKPGCYMEWLAIKRGERKAS